MGGSEIVVVNGVRYRRDDAERRGLLASAPAPSPEVDAVPATEPPDDGLGGKLRRGLGLPPKQPKNKAATPENKAEPVNES